MYHREHLRQICAHRMKIIVDIDCEHRVITFIIEIIWDKIAHIYIPVRMKEDLTWLTYSDYTWLDRLSKVIRSCRNIEGLECTHRTVNHSVNFVDPQTVVHTQAIESYWNRHKAHIKQGALNKLTQFTLISRWCEAAGETSCMYTFKILCCLTDSP